MYEQDSFGLPEVGESSLKIFSIGYVIKDKEPDTDIIEVYPVETLPLTDGNVAAFKEVVKGGVVDRNDQSVTLKIERSYYVKARWLAWGDNNRLTPPDVVTGDTVLLFRYADNETYYWTKIHTEPTIRKQETVKYVYSNTPQSLTPITEENTYWVSVSTREKHIRLHTSDNDGEHTTYDIEIDTAEGTLTIDDGKGNYIHLNSKDNDLIINILRDLVIDVGRDMHVTVGRDMKLQIGNNYTATIGNKEEITAPTYIHNGNQYIVNAPQIILNGNVHVTQNLNVDGSTKVAGPVSSSVSFTSPGTYMGGGSVKSSRVEASTVTAGSCSCPNLD